MDCISEERAACLFKWATREPHVVLLSHSANVRLNEVRSLSFLGDVEIGSSGEVSKTPSLTAAKATESICLPIPPKPFGNTGGMVR